MCLVTYSDVLPRLLHDELMGVVESALGQSSKDLADVLHRSTMSDGRNMLEVLHKSGLIKKVQTGQVVVTPTPNVSTNIRLDELNKLLAELATGDAAVKRMAELDQQRGLSVTQKKAEPREVGEPAVAPGVTALSDADIRANLLKQAESYRTAAEASLKEATLLEQQAAALNNADTEKATQVPA